MTWVEAGCKMINYDIYHKEAYLDEEQQLVQILHLVPLRHAVVPAGVQARAPDGASVQGQIHGLSKQVYGLVAHGLVHVAVQLVCEGKDIQPAALF